MTVEEVIRASVARCDRIVAGIEDVRPILAPILPATDDDLSQSPLLERIASIAMLKRYEQLQDMLGGLFRAYLSWEAEDVRATTRRDQASQLEKMGIVDDADEWIDAVELWNRPVREYPIAESEQVDRVNDTWAAMQRLTTTYAVPRTRIAARGLLP
ncbi:MULTISPECIES: hypothetical protein [unclassified Sphingomonas]|uniref:hypothetical protein n=1 Tax=unclassified Sphingomonas TaxID=196159 RepID=UPI002269F829|nr:MULTISPECIES: hypothetical protein [unclassified Sphingomonas]